MGGYFTNNRYVEPAPPAQYNQEHKITAAQKRCDNINFGEGKVPMQKQKIAYDDSNFNDK